MERSIRACFAVYEVTGKDGAFRKYSLSIFLYFKRTASARARARSTTTELTKHSISVNPSNANRDILGAPLIPFNSVGKKDGGRYRECGIL